MKITALCCLILALPALPQQEAPRHPQESPEAALPPLEERMSEAARARLEGTKVPGLLAGIARVGEPTRTAAVGIRKSKDATPITAGDLVHIGSCTKAMTSMLAARLVDRGLIQWDSTIAEVLPDLAEGIDAGFGPVTLLDCLTHTSGAPANCEAWTASGELPIVERRLTLARANLQDAPTGQVGETFLYSNLGYMVAGSMLERVGDAPWEELIRQDVFDPLGMATAGFGPPGTEGKTDQPWGHVILQDKVALHYQSDNPEALGPAGRVHLSIADWARFALEFTDAAAQADDGETPFLKPESRRQLVTVRSNGYACGWGLRFGGKALQHSGSNTMWFATVQVQPESGVAYFAVANSASDATREAVGGLLTDLARL